MERQNLLRRIGLLLLLDEDENISTALVAVLIQRQTAFRKRLWLLEKQLRIARIEEDRRLPIRNFVQHIDRQPAIQFKENFRMSREAFEVIT